MKFLTDINIFENFDFSEQTIKMAEDAMPALENKRQYVALAILALDQAGVSVEDQLKILRILSPRHA